MKAVLWTVIPFLLVVLIIGVYARRYRKRGKYSPFTKDFLREPGESLREEHDTIQESLMEALYKVLIVILVSVPIISSVSSTAIPFVLVAPIILVAFYILKIVRLFRKAVTTRLGFEGERAVGQELSLMMRDGAWVYHDIPYRYGNIDHILIASGGVFAVETKAVSKPESKTKKRAEWKVNYDGQALKFPERGEDSSALDQARLHAKHLHADIQKKLGIQAFVQPVVAIPGWYVDRTGNSDVWVLNETEFQKIRNEITKNVLAKAEVDRIAAHFESIARSVRPGSKRLDPDASEHYDFWNNRRYKPPAVD